MILVGVRGVIQILVLLLFVAAHAVAGTMPGYTKAAAGRQIDAATTSSMAAGSLEQAAWPISGDIHDYDPLIDRIGDAQFVLLGEASHGTHEFYRERARITQRLIQEKGFTAIAIEGDWSDAERVNRYVRRMSGDMSAEQALADFAQFPEWMWGNTDIRDFVQWLRAYNDRLPATARRVGFYGLDVYGLFDSADALVRSLDRLDPQAALRARERYQCFAPFRDDPFAYGRAVASRRADSCEQVAAEQLQELNQWKTSLKAHVAHPQADDLFAVLQHARVVKNAEAYYRKSFTGQASTWNMRDQHMAETLDALASSLDARGRPTKLVVWAHNTHVGDMRATDYNESGMLNIGQLMRERHPDQVVLVGFTTYQGSVMAASVWDEPGVRKEVRPALAESYAGRFHDTGIGNFLLLLGSDQLAASLGEPRLERAIGVIYLPETERVSHYFEARLSQQFDAVIHWDETRAVEPLSP
jgi:erythromycin esterase-like protein